MISSAPTNHDFGPVPKSRNVQRFGAFERLPRPSHHPWVTSGSPTAKASVSLTTSTTPKATNEKEVCQCQSSNRDRFGKRLRHFHRKQLASFFKNRHGVATTAAANGVDLRGSNLATASTVARAVTRPLERGAPSTCSSRSCRTSRVTTTPSEMSTTVCEESRMKVRKTSKTNC